MKTTLPGPDKNLEKNFKNFHLEEFEIYDLLAHIIHKEGLNKFSRELANYLSDYSEHLYAGIYQEEGGPGHVGLSAARAVDACAVLAEALRDKAREYKL